MRKFSRDLAFRVTEEQRDFLETYASENGIGICAAARYCINTAMKFEKATRTEA